MPDIEVRMLLDQNVRGGSFRVSEPTHQAPLNAYRRQTAAPKPSSYRMDEGPTNAEGRVEYGSFGAWLTNMTPLKTEWRYVTEPEGLGRGDDDRFQEQVATAIVANRGGYVAGRGGSGKSYVIDKLKEKFEAAGFVDIDEKTGERKSRVHCIAFTHVAANNVEGNTTLHELHRFSSCLLYTSPSPRD